MKRLICCLLLVSLGIACQNPNAARGSGSQAIVAKAEGSSEFLPKGQATGWQPVRSGWVLAEGDQARTGADGQIDFQITPHGGVVTLMPNSTLEIEQLGPRGTTGTNQNAVATLRLTRGRVVGDTLKLPKGSKVVVKTNAGTFAIP